MPGDEKASRRLLEAILGRQGARELTEAVIIAIELTKALRVKVSAEKLELILEEADQARNKAQYLLKELEYVANEEEVAAVRRRIEMRVAALDSRGAHKNN